MMKPWKLIPVIFTIAIFLLFTSCLSSRKYEKEEEQVISDYIAAHTDQNWTKKSSGLYYLEVLAGSGSEAEAHDTAFILYTAKYLNGNTFDTNAGTTDTLIAPISEGYLIQGFDEGVSYMNAGGKAQLIVPSYLGYGQSGWYFPAYTPILFEVYLVKLIKGP